MNSDKYSKKTTGATTPIGKSFKGSISITLNFIVRDRLYNRFSGCSQLARNGVTKI